MPLSTRFLGPAVLLVALTGSPAIAEAGNAEDGAVVFKKCVACHNLDPEKKKIGPHLKNVVGRPAGSVVGYKYSSAMTESGLTWDMETLDAYLEDPRGTVPGTNMAFPGLKKPEDRANVIAYIESESD